jgi:hypothetical protein
MKHRWDEEQNRTNHRIRHPKPDHQWKNDNYRVNGDQTRKTKNHPWIPQAKQTQPWHRLENWMNYQENPSTTSPDKKVPQYSPWACIGKDTGPTSNETNHYRGTWWGGKTQSNPVPHSRWRNPFGVPRRSTKTKQYIWINTKTSNAIEFHLKYNEKKEDLPLEQLVPPEYQEYLDVFDEIKLINFLDHAPGIIKSN